MVTDSTLDSKEEKPRVFNRKGMENTVDNRPEENPSPSSKVTNTSDTAEEEYLSPTVMTWIMIPVAAGLLTIYTMVNWISNKLTQEVENGKKTEEHMSPKYHKATEIITKRENDTTVRDTCCCTNIRKTDLETLHENTSESNGNDNFDNNFFQNFTTIDISKRNEEIKDDEDGLSQGDILVSKDNNVGAEKFENNISEHVKSLPDGNNNHEQCKVSQNFESMCPSHKVTGEKSKDTEDSSDKNMQPHSLSGNVECQNCQNNSHLISVQMGPGFTGNLSISSGTSAECGDVSTINTKIKEDETSCRCTATLQSCNTTPVMVNYLQTKCLTCHAEVSKSNNNELSSSGKQSLENNITEYEKRSNNITEQADSSTPERNIDGPEHSLSSTITCIQTTLKVLHCDVPANNTSNRELLSQLPSSDFLPPSSDTNVGFEDNVNVGDIKEDKLPESDSTSLLHCFPIESTCSKPKESFNEAATTKASPSLHCLANCRAPQETTDGSLLSKNSSGEGFIFPLDNDTTKENQTGNCFKENDLGAPRARFLRNIRDDPALSKSFDSQVKSLEKGCKLLEKKPSKSALRSVGSEGCLKKFVHFPEDIRNIRKVHKYHSFDESWYDLDADDTSKNN